MFFYEKNTLDFKLRPIIHFNQMKFLSTPVFAQWGEPFAVPAGKNEVATLKGLELVFQKILNYAVMFAVVVLFILLVIGGFKFLTSGGDPKATESAQKTLTYAILGIVLLIAIWFILLFIEKFTGIKVTQFTIG